MRNKKKIVNWIHLKRPHVSRSETNQIIFNLDEWMNGVRCAALSIEIKTRDRLKSTLIILVMRRIRIHRAPRFCKFPQNHLHRVVNKLYIEQQPQKINKNIFIYLFKIARTYFHSYANNCPSTIVTIFHFNSMYIHLIRIVDILIT